MVCVGVCVNLGGGVLCVDFVDHSQSVNNNLMTVPRMCSTFT